MDDHLTISPIMTKSLPLDDILHGSADKPTGWIDREEVERRIYH